MNARPLTEIVDLYRSKAHRRYGLTSVTQLEHALQGASLAERDGAPPALIVATLLHDVGHMIHDLGEAPAAHGVNDAHERLGHAFLRQRFGEEVSEPVRLHVAAKRYLCHADPGYGARLSDDSVRSLRLQGGPMNARQAAAFRALPWWEEAVRLRRYDDEAKIVGAATPPLEHFVEYLERCVPTARA